jgi:hypothetical protein
MEIICKSKQSISPSNLGIQESINPMVVMILCDKFNYIKFGQKTSIMDTHHYGLLYLEQSN